MQSFVSHSGYGYRKRLCEDVTTWFLNQFLLRHKIVVDILHRSLKSEGAYGYCDYVGSSYRPREFLIELNTYMEEELYIKTLLHELTHLKQWVDRKLQVRNGKMCYCKEPVENYEYAYQPHEIEAREQEETLYAKYLKGKGIVPVLKVSCFPLSCPRHLL